MRRREVAELRTGVRQEQPGTPAGGAVTDAVLLGDGPKAVRGTRVCDGATGQSAADDDNVGRVVAPEPREIGSAGGRRLMNPG